MLKVKGKWVSCMNFKSLKQSWPCDWIHINDLKVASVQNEGNKQVEMRGTKLSSLTRGYTRSRESSDTRE